MSAEGWHRANGRRNGLSGAENYRESPYRLGGATSGDARDTLGRFQASSAGDVERFRALVEGLDGAGCWPWAGRLTRDGYPLFDIKVPAGGWVPVRAHRWAWEHTYGPLPVGWTLDHDCHSTDLTCPGGPRCRHRRCVRLDHLVPMTNADNLRRRHARRRGQEPR